MRPGVLYSGKYSIWSGLFDVGPRAPIWKFNWGSNRMLPNYRLDCLSGAFGTFEFFQSQCCAQNISRSEFPFSLETSSSLNVRLEIYSSAFSFFRKIFESDPLQENVKFEINEASETHLRTKTHPT